MYTPPVFTKDASVEWLAHLEAEGYAVIGDIMSREERNEGLELFWKDWTSVSPTFDRSNSSSWSIRNSPMMFAKGMAVFSGFGQSDFMWNVRLHPNVKGIFETIHQTTDLVTSFDGFSVFFSKKQKNPKPWWHIDQHPENPRMCVQGAYNFLPVTADSAGLTVVPRSHTNWTPATLPKKAVDWIPICDDPILSGGVKLIIPENSFVLWNSRLIHANVGMTAETRPPTLNRLTCYVTYLPRAWRSAQVLEAKVSAYKTGDATSHWAHRCEIKKYPWGFGPQYEKKEFVRCIPRIGLGSGSIPAERLAVM